MASAQSGWKMIYQNDEKGKAVSGDINNLIEAIRAGKPVRFGWKAFHDGNPEDKVEHVVEGRFTTIMSDKVVFVQSVEINAQAPNFETEELLLRENMTMVFIASSNGQSEYLFTNSITGEVERHNQIPKAFDWYVFN